MQFELVFRPFRREPTAHKDWVQVGGRLLPLRLVPNRRARRYVLRLQPNGIARVTVPRGGSAAEARRFASRNAPWLERQLLRQALRPARAEAWTVGSEILFRGERVKLERAMERLLTCVRFADQQVPVSRLDADVRPHVEAHLHHLAARELPARVLELAALHNSPVRRISVRNQRSRWGSASRRGTISLNWRLVQAPMTVRDYIIIHELAHLKEMNHSPRFWREVERICPNYREAEQWLKAHSELLR